MPVWSLILLQLAAIAYALVGGVFLAFSDFIMRSLSRTGGSGGIDAMQVINREVFGWLFMTLLIGMAPVSLAFVVFPVFGPASAPALLIASAGLVYVFGCFGVTVVFNVPMNEKLAKMELEAETTRAYWTDTYVPRWTMWNSVRAMACVISAVLLLIGTLLMAQAGNVS